MRNVQREEKSSPKAKNKSDLQRAVGIFRDVIAREAQKVSIFMYVVKPSNKKRSSKPIVKAGEYTAEATSITFYDKYADDEAFRINYTLTDDNGNQFDYSEIFFNDTSNPRTLQFVEYCDDAGIPRLSNCLPDIVGHSERIVLKHRINFKYPVIVEREFIISGESSGDELPNR